MGRDQGAGMSFWKKFLIVKLCIRLAYLPLFLVFQPFPSAAQVSTASDAAYWNMNRALSGVTQEALANRGYVLNDPRTYATLSHMSNAARIGVTSAAGAAAGAGAVVLAGVTAPAWASVALFIGVSAVASYGINLALDSFVNWAFRSDQKIDSGAIFTPVPVSNALNTGGPYWSATFTGVGTAFGADGEALSRQAAHHNRARAGLSTTGVTCTYSSTSTPPVWNCGNGWASAYSYPSGSPVSCVAGAFSLSGSCQGYSFVQPVSTPAKTGISISTAVNDIPAQELSKPLNPQLVAAVANRLWQQAAAQPGYSGIPYPQSNPISTQEVTKWQQANPQVWPSVRDFVSPRADASTNTNSVALPSGVTQPATVPTTFTTSPNPATTNPASSSPLTNLGEDPAIGSPTLETPPTAQQILDPVLNMLPGHRSFTASSHQGICPTPTINLYGSHVMDAHCTLIDQNKSVIQGAMTFAWAVIALFIILSA